MRKVLAKFLYLLGDYKSAFFGLQIAILLNSILEAFGLGLIGPFIALASLPKLIDKQPILLNIYVYSRENFYVTSRAQFVAYIGFAVILAYILKSIASLEIRKKISDFALTIQMTLRLRLHRAYLRYPYSFHLDTNTSFLINNIIHETGTFSYGVVLESLNYSVSLTMFITLSALVIIADPIGCLFIVAMFLIVIVIYLTAKRNLGIWGKTLSEAGAETIRAINHSIGAIKEVKIIGCESYFEELFKMQTNKLIDVQKKQNEFSLIPRLVIEVIIITSTVGLVSVILLTTGENINLIAKLSIFGLVAIRLLPNINQLSSGMSKLQGSRHTIDILYNELKCSDFNWRSSHSSSSVCSGFTFESHIDLLHVHYRYPHTSHDVIQDVTLRIKKGESIAFIGKSGAGKTTLVDIILGLLQLTQGDIVIDSKTSICEYPLEWRRLIGYIPQSIYLLDDTFIRNIAFGIPDHLIDFKKLTSIVEVVNLKEVVDNLPSGLDSRLGERGVLLSGGQRQRIGIARALYHDKEILVLDEATSALDQETENSVVNAIKNLGSSKTTITIAHRLNTIQHCDRIYVLNKGRIIQSGSYDEIILGDNFKKRQD